jgi:hypothetical protein
MVAKKNLVLQGYNCGYQRNNAYVRYLIVIKRDKIVLTEKSSCQYLIFVDKEGYAQELFADFWHASCIHSSV